MEQRIKTRERIVDRVERNAGLIELTGCWVKMPVSERQRNQNDGIIVALLVVMHFFNAQVLFAYLPVPLARLGALVIFCAAISPRYPIVVKSSSMQGFISEC
jgi:hypothetical protein